MISTNPAPSPTNRPTMVMAKKAGPSAVSYCESCSLHVGQLSLTLTGPWKIWPLPHDGQRAKKAAFQFGFTVLVMAGC